MFKLIERKLYKNSKKLKKKQENWICFWIIKSQTLSGKLSCIITKNY